MKLYHGSNQIIKKPDLSKGRKFLDFGSGFYLSDETSQAENRAKSAVLFFEEGTIRPLAKSERVCHSIVSTRKISNTISFFHSEELAIFTFYR